MMDLDAVKAATLDLHIQAERSGIIADILTGRATRFGVALMLRNLLPAYRMLDTSLFGNPALARSAAIEADLHILSPCVELPLLAEGSFYAEQICRARQDSGPGMIAHAYVRYLGDLNGGQIMQRRLVGCLGEVARALCFHDYRALGDKAAFTRDYRAGLDRAVRLADFDAVVRESMVAFEINIMLSKAVRTAASAAARPVD